MSGRLYPHGIPVARGDFDSVAWAPTIRAGLPPVLGEVSVVDIASDRARLVAAMREILGVIADHNHHSLDRLQAVSARAEAALRAVGVTPPSMPRRLY